MPKSLFCKVILLALLAGCEAGSDQALGTLEWDRVNGRAEASEVIVELFVAEGDRVSEGQPLLQLDTSLIDAQIHQLEAASNNAQWRLKELQRGPRAQEIAQARARLDAAKSNVVTQELELDRQQKLVKTNYTTERDVDIIKNRLQAAHANQREAEQVLDLLLEGTRDEQIQQASAALEQTQAQLAVEQARRERYTVVAARDGRVDNIVYKLGDKPPMGSVVVTLLAGDQPYARVYIPAPWRAQVKPGATFPVHVDGADRLYTAKVRKISADAAFTPYYALSERDRARLSYLAELDLQEPQARDLAVGMTLQVDLPPL